MSSRSGSWLIAISGYFCVGLAVPSHAQSGPAAIPDRSTAALGSPDILRDYRDAEASVMDRATALTARRRARCVRQSADEILVCADNGRDQRLPLPHERPRIVRNEIPRPPTGMPCGRSISNNCYQGVDVVRAVGATAKLIGLAIDPDADLGAPDPIPPQFRGSNP